MKRIIVAAFLTLFAVPGQARAQLGGNISYSEPAGSMQAKERERDKRIMSAHELPPTGTSAYIECNVLMNVRADAYVAVFGISQFGETLAECNDKVAAAVETFSAPRQQNLWVN